MKERDYRLDLIRLISIFFVVVIHFSNYYNRRLENFASTEFIFSSVYNAVARISVPLFFMISGALTLGYDMPYKKLGKKIAHFIFVLAFWTVVYICVDVFYYGAEFELEDYLTLPFTPLKAHLWFMYAITALYIVSPFVRILVKNLDHKLQMYFIFLWMGFCGIGRLTQILLQYFEIQASIRYDLPLVQGTYYLGYFLVGYVLYDKFKKGYRINKMLLWSSFLLSTLATVLGTIVYSLEFEDYYDEFYNYRTFFIMSATLSVFCLLMQTREITSEKVKNTLKCLSPLLFGVYLTHILAFEWICKNYNVLSLHPVYMVPLLSVVVFAIALAFTFAISKIPGVRKIVQ